MSFRVGLVCLLLATTSLGACGGGTVQPRGPDGPDWSLTDRKPQGLGAPNAAPAPSGTYEYRGGRDAVTGQARTIQGTPAGKGPAATTAAPGARTIEVRKGDTLHGLSLQHHVSVDALMAANNLPTPKIVLGQRLIVPPPR